MPTQYQKQSWGKSYPFHRRQDTFLSMYRVPFSQELFVETRNNPFGYSLINTSNPFWEYICASSFHHFQVEM